MSSTYKQETSTTKSSDEEPSTFIRKDTGTITTTVNSTKQKSIASVVQNKITEDPTKLQKKVTVNVTSAALQTNKKLPTPTPPLNVRPLVLAIHLVPSLPIDLFELLAKTIEAATQLPVSLIYEPRTERPVAKDIVDLAVLPAYGEWEDADLLPVTFVFDHQLNNNQKSGNIYVDIIVASDRASHVENILDLRGHRCALPDRYKRRGAAALLLGDLRVKGEGPAFFGNTLDSDSQISVLKMVVGRQAEVGVLEAPVLHCQRRKITGGDSFFILGSLGPLPPYAIYAKKSMSDELRQKISSYLLDVKYDKDWIEQFSPYGVIGFASNSLDNYMMEDDGKEIPSSVRYY